MPGDNAGMTPVPDSQESQPAGGSCDAPVVTSIEVLVRALYESLWEDYSSWHIQDSQKTLANLARPVTRAPARAERAYTPPVLETPPIDTLNKDDAFEITDFDDGNEVISTYLGATIKIDATDLLKLDAFKPYPEYDACAAISRSTMKGDDSEYLPFFPFSDDPDYDYEFDNDNHKYLAWQKPYVDPDSAPLCLVTTWPGFDTSS